MNRFRRILRLVWEVLFPYEVVNRSKHQAPPSAPVSTTFKIKHSA